MHVLPNLTRSGLSNHHCLIWHYFVQWLLPFRLACWKQAINKAFKAKTYELIHLTQAQLNTWFWNTTDGNKHTQCKTKHLAPNPAYFHHNKYCWGLRLASCKIWICVELNCADLKNRNTACKLEFESSCCYSEGEFTFSPSSIQKVV